PKHVGSQNSLRSRRNGGFQQVRVQAQRIWVDVHEHGPAVLPDQAARGGHVGKGRREHLAGEVQRLDGQLQRQRAVAYKKQVPHAQLLPERLL
nr:hypothetical protein [Tanacetum cinerariifolium]